MFETILRDVFAGTCDNFVMPKSDATPTPDVSKSRFYILYKSILMLPMEL